MIEERSYKGGTFMKKALHTAAIIAGVVSGLIALVAPIVFLLRHAKARHASFPEE